MRFSRSISAPKDIVLFDKRTLRLVFQLVQHVARENQGQFFHPGRVVQTVFKNGFAHVGLEFQTN